MLNFSHPNMSTEVNLLLRCTRTEIDSETAEDIDTLLREDIDWLKITRLALRNGVVPLLYKSLISISPKTVPQDVLVQLKEHYLFNLQSNLYLTNELLEIYKNFSEKEIQIIPYKGPVLTQSIYGNLGLRQFSDLDIIVHKNDIKKAKEVLLSQGYKLTWPEIKLTDKQEASHIQAKYNYQFTREDDGVTVELHWNITPEYLSFPQNPEWLWQRLVSTTLSNITLSTFSPEDYLIILCVHGSNHCWLRLRWICDVNELVQNTVTLNWEKVAAEARTQGCERMVLSSLLLSSILLGTDLPQEIQHRVEKNPEVITLANQVVVKLAENSYIGAGLFDVPRYHLQARDNLKDRWRYLHSLTAPSVKEWSFIQLPESLDYLYYLLRPIRLGVEYGVKPLVNQFNQIMK
jgi:hypothetical protein